MSEITYQVCEETGKICYSRREAGSIANASKKHKDGQRTRPRRSYFCKACGCYHTTHFKTFGYRKGERNKYEEEFLYEYA